MGKRRGAPPYNIWCNLAARRAIDVTQLAGHPCDKVQLGLILATPGARGYLSVNGGTYTGFRVFSNLAEPTMHVIPRGVYIGQ
jgi:hypothetical protein